MQLIIRLHPDLLGSLFFPSAVGMWSIPLKAETKAAADAGTSFKTLVSDQLPCPLVSSTPSQSLKTPNASQDLGNAPIPVNEAKPLMSQVQ